MSKVHHQKAYIQARIINRLRDARGGWVTTTELTEYLYGTCSINNPALSLIAAVRRLRRNGFPIATAWTRGYRYAPELWRPLPSAQA